MSLQAPATVKTWRVTGYDGLDSLKLSEEAIPRIGDDEVLVKSKYDRFCPVSCFSFSWRKYNANTL
jgi:hypothetical protein